MAKLLAIDGLNIVRRVYEASPEPDSDLKATIALRHAFSSFRNLLETHAPTHVLPPSTTAARPGDTRCIRATASTARRCPRSCARRCRNSRNA